MLSILLIPAALCYTFGKMVGDTRQGWAILIAMLILLVVVVGSGRMGRSRRQPAVSPPWASIRPPATSSRAEIWKAKSCALARPIQPCGLPTTTAASNGSVNSMHDSFTPLGGLVPLVMMMFGEVVFGGVGSGLYGMLVFVIVAVFVAGLMVGRTPEYLGKKIEAYEMKMASLLILIMPLTVLGLTAVAVSLERRAELGVQPRAAWFQRDPVCLHFAGQ